MSSYDRVAGSRVPLRFGPEVDLMEGGLLNATTLIGNHNGRRLLPPLAFVVQIDESVC